MSSIATKLWGYAGVLLEDGIDYGDYVEQITYLLFLKMAAEKDLDLPNGCRWSDLARLSGEELLDDYQTTLRTLSKQKGILGQIYYRAESRFKKPERLKKLVNMIDEEDWASLDLDVKGDAYEGLVERAAAEGKKGMGQFFTPRRLIEAVVRCVKPDPRTSKNFTLIDPACGTGGFVLSAYGWLKDQTGGAMERTLSKRVHEATYFGQDHGDRPRRLALMNFYLHGLAANITGGDTIYDPPGSARYDVVLTNPPFKSSSSGGMPTRDDFVVSTSNKQLNFLQHLVTVLKPGGRGAIVLPDSVLFTDQAADVMQQLCERCDLHTVLRLPRGTFSPYCPGVKANVLFFTKGLPTNEVWIYDGRTNVPGVTKKDRPLTETHFAEFERCYGIDPAGRAGVKKGQTRSEEDSPDGGPGWLGGNRWRPFSIGEVKGRDYKLDGFKWLREDSLSESSELPEPAELATDAISELEAAIDELNQLMTLLENGNRKSSNDGSTPS
jgi:type I restriction enzyme M protein